MGEGEVDLLPEETTKHVRRRKKKLYNSILQQMEFYFSDSNLSKDRFLSQLLAESPFIDIECFLKFNKIRKLNCTVEEIQKALQKSEIIEVTEDNKICRKKPFQAKHNVDACTIYVENIKSDTTHEWLSELFSEFGKVAYVSIPKYKQKKVNKGFAFLEFETEEEANNALLFFESIDLKMPSDKDPEQLRSIATFEGDTGNLATNEEQPTNKCEFVSEDDIKAEVNKASSKETEKEIHKRKHSTSDSDESNVKKMKTDDSHNEEAEVKKKKKKTKRDKKKAVIKELGIQILSKKEWKKLRNKYLDLQKKKMKEFKNYLYKQRFSQKVTEKVAINDENSKDGQKTGNADFVSGVVVKVKTEEACADVKKLKAELKSIAADIKYVDIPYPGSQEFFLRFATPETAIDFCKKDVKLENTNVNEKYTLSGEEDTTYWRRMEESRNAKFEKQNKKQRGRDKLLKKANKEQRLGTPSAHIRFEESCE